MSSPEVTQLLVDYSNGQHQLYDRIISALYKELQVIAQGHMRRESSATIQSTDLVHEAYLKLIDQKSVNWQNRNHFLAMCSHIMRRLLIDRARSRKAQKRGGDHLRITLDASANLPDNEVTDQRLLEIDQALEELRRLSERQSKVVELRYFGGMSVEEVAETLEVSTPTIKRDWRVAKAWLSQRLA